MKLGVYTAALHDMDLRDALTTISALRIVGAEINAGGFLPSPHLPVDALLSGEFDVDEYLAVFAETGTGLTGLNPTSLGGRHTVNRWPEQSSLDFVAVGLGHDVGFWARFLAALNRIDPEMAVNVEHEDVELGQHEGLQTAAETLLAAHELTTQPA